MPRHPFMPRHSLAARRGARILAAIALVFTALGPVAGPAAGGRRTDDGGAHPARRSCPARVVGRDLRPSQERRPGGQRRAPPRGRLAGPDELRDGGRAADPVRPGPRPVRPAAGVRHLALGQPGRRRQDDRDGQADIHHPRRDPARRRRRRRASRADRRQPRSPAEPEPGRAGDRDPDPRRPARTRRGLVGDRPDRLAGRRLGAAVDAAARRPPRLDRRWRTTRHRRRDRRPEDPLGVPRQPAPLPAGGHHRCPGLDPERDPRPDPARRRPPFRLCPGR